MAQKERVVTCTSDIIEVACGNVCLFLSFPDVCPEPV